MRKERIAKILQYTLSDFFNKKISIPNTLITITDIQIISPLQPAKIYLSFITIDNQLTNSTLLQKIKDQKSNIKKHLAQHLKNKLRRMPDFDFYTDDTVQKALQLEKLLEKTLQTNPQPTVTKA